MFAHGAVPRVLWDKASFQLPSLLHSPPVFPNVHRVSIWKLHWVSLLEFFIYLSRILRAAITEISAHVFKYARDEDYVDQLRGKFSILYTPILATR